MRQIQIDKKKKLIYEIEWTISGISVIEACNDMEAIKEIDNRVDEQWYKRDIKHIKRIEVLN